VVSVWTTAAGRIATAIGTRKPLPTHMGSSTSHAGNRSPQGEVRANASTTTTRSIANVIALATTVVGSDRNAGSRAPTVLPESQRSLMIR